MCHSHLDVGYTHPQPMLLELQGDFIEQAIELCQKTREYPKESQFRWTCEATYPVVKWMEQAEPEKIKEFLQLVTENRISIAALPMHLTPCSTVGKMVSMLKDLDELREALQAPINTAINHDVNGQPWTMTQILLDSHVDFYMTGINIHFGGIPYKRPMAFWWSAPDGRKLLSYVGEHYSLFSQLFYTWERDTKRMHQGIQKYVERLERQNHEWDFAFLTATNPPMYDNNCPDWDLPDLIRKYNEEGHEYIIRMVTPEMLYEKLLSMGEESFPSFSGDWTDYWNFGSASSAREVRVNRLAQRTLETASVLECMNGGNDRRSRVIRKEAELKSLMYDEHTWGASQAISDPHDYESQSQVIHKNKLAYEAADLAGYLLAKEVERLEENPYQTDTIEGISVINPTGVTQKVELIVPREWRNKERHLSAARAKRYIPYINRAEKKAYFVHEEQEFCGYTEVPPYSYKVIPFTQLGEYQNQNEKIKIQRVNGALETPYYKITLNECTGRIEQIVSKIHNQELLNTDSPWTFFEVVRETIDIRFHKNERFTLFPRDVDKGNESISVWQHDWKANRTGPEQIVEWDIQIHDDRAELIWKSELPGTKWLEQKVVFYTDREEIDMTVKLHKLPVETPEAFYLAFPLKLNKNWKCVYNTAGQYVTLDEEQLGHVCRDWVTVDNGTVMFDDNICYGLASSEAPLIQIGDFNFGKERSCIERKENPLLLAWPLNNYWDTNFVAAQSDVMEFTYRFYCKDAFQRTEMYQEFLREEKRGLIGAVVHAEEKVVTLIEASEEGVITHISLVKQEKEALILQLKNQELEKKELTIRIPAWKNFSAEPVTMQEKETGIWKAEGSKVCITLQPQELLLVKVKQSNVE